MSLRFPTFWQKRFLLYEALSGAAITAAVAYLVENRGVEVLHNLLGEDRGTLYATFSTLFGALMGFVIASISIIISYTESEKLAAIRADKKNYRTLLQIFTSSIRWCGAATLVALTALVVDKGDMPVRWVAYLVLGTSLVATFRTMRTIWIVEKVVAITAKETADDSSTRLRPMAEPEA